MTANEFFTNLNGGARWDVGVSINRSNKLPLDANSVFPSLAEAQAYVAGTHPTRLSNAYPGQILSVVTEDGKTKIYATELNAEGALVLVNFAAIDDVPEVIHPEYQMVDISSTLTDEEKKTIAKRYALTKDGTQLTVKIDIPQVPEVIHPEYEVKALALTEDDVAAGVA
jgi:TusA-related sulfurtransferase